jgi:predicted RNase H-like nuclease (RuvC/YqgF family)
MEQHEVEALINSRITPLEAEITNLRDQVAVLQQQLSEKDQQLAERDKYTAKLKKQMKQQQAETDRQLAERDQRIAELERQIQQQQQAETDKQKRADVEKWIQHFRVFFRGEQGGQSAPPENGLAPPEEVGLNQ